MQNIRASLQTVQIVRSFWVSSARYAGNLSRESRFLNKLVHGKKKRKQHYSNNIVPNATPFSKTQGTQSLHVQQRMTVLNKIFMQHITDLMTTDCMSDEIVDRNIEINDVKVTADFKLINVFWIDNDPNPETRTVSTEDILRKCAMILRHELSQLRVIGCVPPIQFVKCKHAHAAKELERLLSIADYGEDYQPSTYPHSPTTTIKYVENKDHETDEEENTEVEGTQVEEVTNTDAENSTMEFSVTLPVMRHDVFNIDHYRIMSKIKVSLEKTRQAVVRQSKNEQLYSAARSTLNTAMMSDLSNVVTKEEEGKDFAAFLAQRKKEEFKKYRMQRSRRKQERLLNMMNEDDDDVDSEDRYENDPYVDDYEYPDDSEEGKM